MIYRDRERKEKRRVLFFGVRIELDNYGECICMYRI